jgi:hypothetical protein
VAALNENSALVRSVQALLVNRPNIAPGPSRMRHPESSLAPPHPAPSDRERLAVSSNTSGTESRSSSLPHHDAHSARRSATELLEPDAYRRADPNRLRSQYAPLAPNDEQLQMVHSPPHGYQLEEHEQRALEQRQDILDTDDHAMDLGGNNQGGDDEAMDFGGDSPS